MDDQIGDGAQSKSRPRALPSPCAYIPARQTARVKGSKQSGGPHAGFAFGNWCVWCMEAMHRGGAARARPEICRMMSASDRRLPRPAAPARTRPLQHDAERVRHESRGQSPKIRHRPGPLSNPPLRPKAIADCEGCPVAGLARSRRTGCQRSTPASASSWRPAARYGETRRPSSRLDRHASEPSGGGSG